MFTARHRKAGLAYRAGVCVMTSFWTAPRIADRASGWDNNFNLLRILAAVGVLISHAYPISLGVGVAEPLSGFLGGVTLGTVSVMIFFSISGFFITRSFAGRRCLASFVRARALRLFPALIAVLAVTVLVSGLWLTTAPAGEFWAAVPNYIWRNATLFAPVYDLPGEFGANPYGPAINGSLWTLNYEVLCYFGVVLAGLAGLLNRPWAFAVALACFAAAYGIDKVHPLHPRIDNLLTLGLPFVIGMAFWVWRKVIPLSPLVALVLLAAVYLTRQTSITEPVLAVAIAYAVFVIGYANIPILARYNRMGDYSYGTYVYAFPLQQMLAAAGIVLPLANMLLALPLTLLCAVLSWHLVEAPTMRLK
jgi:peptidoglycan/LPS O-acetylase OafA/YrhL